MRLSTVEAHSLPGVRDFKVDLSRPTVILGPNEAGKSTLLRLTFLALEGPPDRLGVSGQVGASFESSEEPPWSMWRAQTERGQQAECRRAGEVHTGVRRATDAALAAIGPAGQFRAIEFQALSAAKRQGVLDRALSMDWKVRSRIDLDLMRRFTEPVSTRYRWESYSSDQQMLQVLEEALGEAKRVNERAITSLRGASKNQTAPPASLPPGTVASHRAEVERLEAEIGEVRQRVGEEQGREKARQTLQDQSARLRAELKAAEASRAEIAELGQRIAKGREVVEQRKQSLASKVEAETEAQAAETSVMTERTAAWNEASELEVEVARRQAAAEAIGQFGRLVDAVRSALEAWPEVPAIEERVELQEAFAEVDALTAPEVGEAMAKRLQESRTRAQALEMRLTSAQRTRQRARAAHDTAKGDVTHAEQLLGQLERKRENLRGQVQSSDKAAAELRVVEDALAELPPAPEQLAAVLLQSLQEQKRKAIRNIDILNDAAAAQASVDEQRVKLTRALALREEIREATKEVRAIARAAMESSLSPVVGPASALCSAAMGAEMRIVYDDAGAHVWLEAPGRPPVPLEHASDSQTTIGLMALQVALQAQFSGWRHAFVDELEALDHQRRTAFVEAMRDWQTHGLVDNFVAACVDDGWNPPEGVQVIRLEMR